MFKNRYNPNEHVCYTQQEIVGMAVMWEETWELKWEIGMLVWECQGMGT